MQSQAIALYVMYLVAILLIVSGLLILSGKGDWLISGYNTASKEKKATYNMTRLRRLTGIFSFASALLLAMLAVTLEKHILPETVAAVAFTVLVTLGGIVVAVLSNTWARKK